MVASVETAAVGRESVVEAVRSEPWSFVLLGLAGGILAGVLLKSPFLRRALRIYRKLP